MCIYYSIISIFILKHFYQIVHSLCIVYNVLKSSDNETDDLKENKDSKKIGHKSNKSWAHSDGYE